MAPRFKLGFENELFNILLLKNGFRQAKTQKGRRFLADRAPKVIENTKNTLFIRGQKTSNDVSQWLNDVVRLNL